SVARGRGPAQQQRKMRTDCRSRQRCRMSVQGHGCIGEPFARAGPTTKSGTAFGDRRAPPVMDPELGDETEHGRAELARPEEAGEHPRDHDTTGPRGEATGGHCPEEKRENPDGGGPEKTPNRPPP